MKTVYTCISMWEVDLFFNMVQNYNINKIKQELKIKMKNKTEKLNNKDYKNQMKFMSKLIKLFHKYFKTDDFMELDFDEIERDLYSSYLKNK